MDLGIAGKVALVTAGSRGLGRATALALAGEGTRVMLSGRDAASLVATRDEVAALGVDVEVRAGDVTDPGEPAGLVAATVERFGGLDILVANAGGPPPGRALDLTDEAIDAALNANLTTSIRLVRESLPHMRAAGWGRICCITSYTVKQAAPMLALSNTARTGLWAWIKTAAQDLASESSGITLNMVCPGPHATDRMRELGGVGVMGDPADFGAVTAFLCSARAGFVNGSAIVVDGGATLAL
ncbi:MAG TPA: SDR family oxidoreductase [Acidimicrobiales bacterium]